MGSEAPFSKCAPLFVVSVLCQGEASCGEPCCDWTYFSLSWSSGGDLYNSILCILTEMQIDIAFIRGGFRFPLRGRIWDINLDLREEIA